MLVEGTTKISVLLFYRRIFDTQTFKRKTSILIVLTAFTWLAAELGIILQCIPLRRIWDPFTAGHCMNFNVFVMVMGVIDLFLDISILCLPMSMIPRLKLSLKQKISLSMIFMFGGL